MVKWLLDATINFVQETYLYFLQLYPAGNRSIGMFVLQNASEC